MYTHCRHTYSIFTQIQKKHQEHALGDDTTPKPSTLP